MSAQKGKKRRLAILWTLVLLATLGGTGYAIAMFWDRFQQFPFVMRRVSLLGWAALAVETAVYYLIDYFRLYFLLKLLGHHLTLGKGLQTLSVSAFATILTPTQEMHIPATVYVLTEGKLSVGDATAAAICKTLYMLGWVIIVGVLMLLLHAGSFPPFLSEYPEAYLVPLGFVVLFFLMTIPFAGRMHAWAARVMNRPGQRRWIKKTLSMMDNATGAVATIGKSTHPLHLLVHLLCLVDIFVYSLVGYTLCQGVGLEISFPHAIAVFTVSLLVAYVAPVPGSIGISEFATSYLLSASLTEESLAVAVLLRFLTHYLPIFPGALLFLHVFRKRNRGDSPTTNNP